MASFSVDGLMKILLRLCTKPLVRFRCVSKSWNSLLTSPFFIKVYLERSIRLQKFDLLKYDFNKFFRIQLLYSSENELSDIDYSFIEDGKNFKLVDSCDGIVCLSIFDWMNPHLSKIFLWNPSTGENRALPQPNLHVSELVGFGFDPSSGHPDDFKVVNVNTHYEVEADHWKRTSQVEVYDFRRNCWKLVGNIFPPSLTKGLDHQVIIKNFICWCLYFRLNDEFVSLLILFDVVKDVFQKVALPDIMPPERKHISLLDGCLSLIAHNSSRQHYEVWIMKEFGICESWTKSYTIGVSAISRVRYRPVGFADSGEVFFLKSSKMGVRRESPIQCVLYNVGSEMFEAFEVEDEVDAHHSTRLVTCAESLISLSSTNDAGN